MKAVFAWISFLAVGIAVLWTIGQAVADFNAQPLELDKIRFYWCGPAALLYFLGMVPSWLYWHKILADFRLQTALSVSFRAFFVSQLGKYVPGKVMVLAIRMSILGDTALGDTATTGVATDSCGTSETEDLPADPPADRLLLVAATALMETLMFIAVGALIGCVAGVYFFYDKIWLAGASALMALVLVLPTLPPIFKWMAKWQPVKKASAASQKAAEGWNWKLVALGWLILPIGWLLLGCSLFSLTLCLPDAAPINSDLPRCLGCISLANVLGFVSLIPGGIGVREVVMYPILGQRFQHALVLVILLRITSLVAELLAAGLGQLIRGPAAAIKPQLPKEKCSSEKSES